MASLRGASDEGRRLAWSTMATHGSGSRPSGAHPRTNPYLDDDFWNPASVTFPPTPPPYIPSISISTSGVSDATAWHIIWKILVVIIVLFFGLMRWGYYRQQKRAKAALELADQEQNRAAFAAVVESPMVPPKDAQGKSV